MNIPNLFRCPISLDLFTDPVTLSTGQTYDRSSIEKWLADGNLTCPVTMQKLHDLSMVPNHTLRHLINQWLLTGAQHGDEHLKKIDADPSLTTLRKHLVSQEATFAEQLEILRKIRSSSEGSDVKIAGIVQTGFFPILVQLLFGDPLETKFSKDNSELAEEALNCLLNLSPYSKMGPLNILKEPSSLASFLILLDQGGIKIKTSLCYLVEAISSSTETQQVCFLFGQTRPILQGLVSLLQNNSDPSTSDAAIRGLSGLCSFEVNHERIIEIGAVDGLIMYISNSERCYIPTALAIFELLLGQESGKRAAISNPNVVHILAKMVFRLSSSEGSESAVGSLLTICYDSSEICKEAVNEGVLTQILLLLQSQCSDEAKNKARILLKLLRSMWIGDPTTCNLQYGVVDS